MGRTLVGRWRWGGPWWGGGGGGRCNPGWGGAQPNSYSTLSSSSSKNLAIAASHLTEQPRNPPEVTALAQLIEAGQKYRTHPSVDAYAQLLAMAISWYSIEGEQSN